MLNFSRSQLASALLLASLAAFAGCSSSNDAATPAAPKGKVGVNAPEGLARPSWAAPNLLAGRVVSDKAISIQVHLKVRNNAGAEAELDAISDPDSPSFGKYLSNEEYDAKYGPTQSDVDGVVAHLQKHGLRISHIPGNRMYVAAQGTAGQVESAFATRLGLYNVDGNLRQAPVDAPTVPAALTASVNSVLGLSESVRFKPQSVRVGGIHRAQLIKALNPAAEAAPAACSEWYGAKADTTDPVYPGYPALTYAPCGYKPAQIRAAYGFNEAIRKGNDGTGVTIAIIDAFQSPTLFEDAQTYAAQNDPDFPLDPAQFSIVVAPGKTDPPPPVDTGWYGEATLDVEAAHATAPGAKLLYVAAESANDQDLVAALNMIVAGKLATIVSNSYGSPEGQANDFVVWQSIVTQAGLKGIGVYFASGDNGDEVAKLGFASPDFPASLVHVTAVGGTSLALDRHGARLYEVGWQTAASFLTPIVSDAGAGEGGAVDAGSTWDPAAPGMYFFGAGGGTSNVYEQPTYQVGIVPETIANLPGALARVIPDVSMLADPITGFLVGQTTDGVYAESATGGTSLACPLFAGVMALAEQNAHRKLGFANTQLYKKRATAFKDVAPTTPQAVALPGGIVVTMDYPNLAIKTAVGYDAVTGLGTPDGKNFLKNIK